MGLHYRLGNHDDQIGGALILLLATEVTFAGMTVGDLVALLTFVFGVLGGIWAGVVWILDKKLVQPLRLMIDKLSAHIDQSDKALRDRDRRYEKLERKVSQHDEKFVRDETKIAELFDEVHRLK